MNQKYTTPNAIYPPCVEPEARNSAVGWHWKQQEKVSNTTFPMEGQVAGRLVKGFDDPALTQGSGG